MSLQFPSATSDPPRTDYTDTPWEDDNGQKWKWQVDALRWLPVIAATGGTTLTSYADQIATLDDYPTTFPPDSHTHTSADISDATSNPTPSKVVKRDAGGNAIASAWLAQSGADVSLISHQISPGGTVWASGVSGNIYNHTEDVPASGSFAWHNPAATGYRALTASNTGVPDKLEFGSEGTAVSMSASGMTFGSTAKGTMLDAMGGGSTGKTLFAAATPAVANAELGTVNYTSILSSQFDTTSNTLANITGMATVTLEANTIYKVENFLLLNSTSGGYQFALSFSQALHDLPSFAGAGGGVNTDTTSINPARVSSSLVRLQNKAAAASSGNGYPTHAWMYFKTGANAPTVTFQFAQASAGTPSGTCSLLTAVVRIIKM